MVELHDLPLALAEVMNELIAFSFGRCDFILEFSDFVGRDLVVGAGQFIFDLLKSDFLFTELCTD
jgi:hypothetical protein